MAGAWNARRQAEEGGAGADEVDSDSDGEGEEEEGEEGEEGEEEAAALEELEETFGDEHLIDFGDSACRGPPLQLSPSGGREGDELICRWSIMGGVKWGEVG